MNVVAIFARISPFLLQGLKAQSSVIDPRTLPYIYTLSKKTIFALARLHASTVLLITHGQSSCQIV